MTAPVLQNLWYTGAAAWPVARAWRATKLHHLAAAASAPAQTHAAQYSACRYRREEKEAPQAHVVKHVMRTGVCMHAKCSHHGKPTWKGGRHLERNDTASLKLREEAWLEAAAGSPGLLCRRGWLAG